MPATFAQPVYSAVVEDQFIDRMGHMNIKWYTHFFQNAIWAFYDTIGFGPGYHERSGFGSFLLESHYVYLNELRQDQPISIFLRVIARRNKVFHLMLCMQRDHDQALAATLESIGIHIDLATRKSTPMKPAMAQLWDATIQKHQSLTWPFEIKTRLSI